MARIQEQALGMGCSEVRGMDCNELVRKEERSI
jgi:hypothetical protein